MFCSGSSLSSSPTLSVLVLVGVCVCVLGLCSGFSIWCSSLVGDCV